MCSAPAWATAESYGELARFGHTGNKAGEFKLNEFSAAFGVDQTESNSVYVGDEPKKGEYRVQKLQSNGSFLGAATFTAECAAGKGGKCIEGTGEQGIEGIAFDTVLNSKSESERRVYVLAGFERAEGAAVDAEKVAAGGLYAFSTKVSSEKLPAAIGTGSEGMLVTPATDKATSEEPAGALLEPKGIAVDPTTHEIIVAGRVDKGSAAGSEGGTHLALQRITDAGALGARYVDPERETSQFVETNSPVVTQTGQVLMQRGSEILEIPTNFSASTAPKVVYQLDATEGIVEFGEEGEEHGAGLSIAPETGGAGTLYADDEVAPGTPTANDGVLALHYEAESGSEEVHVSEFGWLAGASAAGAHHCAIGFEGEFEPPMVSAGAGNKVFVLEPGFNAEKPEPQIVEFGAGGSTVGCPLATATEPQVLIEKVKTSKVHVGKEVTLGSTVVGGNALSVEWSFGDGTSKTVTGDEHEETSVTHTFIKTGVLTVTETIHDDDLATPEIKKTTTVEVEATPPKAVFGSSEVGEGEATTLNGEASTDPNGSYGEPLEYTWEFGDGSKSGPGTEATVKHTYAKSGTYVVTLKVTDALKLTGEVKHEVKVSGSATKAKEQKEKEQKEQEQREREQKEKEAKEREAKEQQEAKTREAEALAKKRQEEEQKGGVLGTKEGAPEATVAGSSLQVSAAGAVSVKISCPTGEASCTGTVTLRTLSAVVASARTAKAKAAILTLGTASFSVPGGGVSTVTLHLSSKGRALLARSHTLRAKATVLAHNPSGGTHSGLIVVTLHLAKGKSKH
ncbi:MAG TPA: PKD domain-containing protein [Solirubrobacteraceae bacterium]|jgi:PKD repeat protein|nr:PKD domain-containing protein [Solirubrobacteraceae bacterium]